MAKRENGSGTIRQRKDGTWEARYTAGIHPGTGKPIRKSIYGKKQEEVAQKLRKVTSEIDSGTYMEPSRMTVKEWFEIWLAEYMGDKKPLTVQQYRSMAETHIYPEIGAVKLSKLTSPQIQKFYNQLAVDGKKGKRKNPETGKMEIVKTGQPLSAKTIRNIHDIISKALNTAVLQGMVRENVSQRVTVPKVIKAEVQPLTEEQQRDFIAAIKEHQFRSIYMLTLFTGLREGEAVGLTWDCFDEKKGTLKVYRQLQRTPGKWSEWRFVPLKNNKTRVIQLSSFTVKLLADQKKYQIEKQRFQAGLAWQGFQNEEERKTAFIFTDDLGNHLNSATVLENFKKIADQIGVPSARFHDLRHTFAVNSLQEGDNPKTVQENLGHHSAAFTLDVYGHVSDRMKEESARRQQAYIARLGIGG